MRIVVLGCGFHGRGVAYELAGLDGAELLVADREARRAESVADKIGCDSLELDIQDTAALRKTLRGADLVFNAVGPYHYRENGTRVVDAAIEERVCCVDMNDDHEVAEALLLDPDWNRRAAAAGIAVITGTGIAPGVTGMLGVHGYRQLERTEAIDVAFSWNYSLAYPAALQHFFRICSGLAPQFIDGEYRRPGALQGREIVTFLPPVGEKPVHYAGINDPVSLSCSLTGLTRVTARGAYHQPLANQLLETMIRFGFTRYESFADGEATLFEYLMAYLRSPAGHDYFDIPMEDAPMAARVTVSGTSDGRPARRVYEVQDYSRRATTSASALVAAMLLDGRIAFTGVRAPEGCVDPDAFIEAISRHPDIRVYAWHDGEQPRLLEPG